MQRETLSQHVSEAIKPFLDAQGVEFVELQLQQHKGRWLVRVFVDNNGGISLEDCRILSFEIGQLLDAEDLVPASYVLEVSSPGLDRPLKNLRDFRRQCQRMVTVFLHSPYLDKAQYTGRVAAVTESHLFLHSDTEAPITIPFQSIDHGVVELEFK
jgi:ribosome maturation factor RimP